MTNIDPWSMKEWIIYKYFPEARELDFNDFLSIENLELVMSKVGFIDIKTTSDYRTTREDLSIFLNYANQRHRTSQFIAISDKAYNDGILRIKNDLSIKGKINQTVESEFCLITVIGDKPGNNNVLVNNG